MNKVINSKKRNDVKIKNSGGFTLVELLAVLAILSIVSVIVSYTATNVIASAKEKSYKVTINNIEKEANTYVLENNKNITWLNYDGTADSYQCIVVQDLIDMGYFDNSVLDSKVSKDRNVRANDYIYMEKDNNTNAITKQVLIFNDNLSYSNICLYYINTEMVGGLEYVFTLFGQEFHLLRQSLSLIALIPIWLYNGKQGYYNKYIKYLYYSFYPCHIMLLWGLKQIVLL